MKCSAQNLWKESYFTNLKLKLQINLIKPIEIAFSYDKWANTSCHPSPISHLRHWPWTLETHLGVKWKKYHGVPGILWNHWVFNAPLCIPNCLCPTLCIWMILFISVRHALLGLLLMRLCVLNCSRRMLNYLSLKHQNARVLECMTFDNSFLASCLILIREWYLHQNFINIYIYIYEYIICSKFGIQNKRSLEMTM